MAGFCSAPSSVGWRRRKCRLSVCPGTQHRTGHWRAWNSRSLSGVSCRWENKASTNYLFGYQLFSFNVLYVLTLNQTCISVVELKHFIWEYFSNLLWGHSHNKCQKFLISWWPCLVLIYLCRMPQSSVYSPYHSNAFFPRFLKKESQYSFCRNSWWSFGNKFIL